MHFEDRDLIYTREHIATELEEIRFLKPLDALHEVVIPPATARCLFAIAIVGGPLATILLVCEHDLTKEQFRAMKDLALMQTFMTLVVVGYFFAIYTSYIVLQNSKKYVPPVVEPSEDEENKELDKSATAEGTTLSKDGNPLSAVAR